MKEYLIIDFIVMVICIVLVAIMAFGTVYSFFHNQLGDGLHGLILTITFAINAYVCLRYK